MMCNCSWMSTLERDTTSMIEGAELCINKKMNAKKRRRLYDLDLGHNHHSYCPYWLVHAVCDALLHPGEPQAVVGNRLVDAVLYAPIYRTGHLPAHRKPQVVQASSRTAAYHG